MVYYVSLSANLQFPFSHNCRYLGSIIQKTKETNKGMAEAFYHSSGISEAVQWANVIPV